jgi:hypothetical protein
MSPASAGLFWAGGSALLSFAAIPLAVRFVAGSSPAALAAGLVPGAILYFALLWGGRERLSLTAFASLLPGRRGRAAPGPAGATAPPAPGTPATLTPAMEAPADTTPARSMHAHGN